MSKVGTANRQVRKRRQKRTVDEDPVRERLQPGQLRSTQLRALIEDLQFQVSLLATVGGVSEQTIRNWRTERDGGVLPEHLDDVRAIALRMVTAKQLPAKRIGPWFSERNLSLEDDSRPVTMIAENRFEDLLEASREAWV